MMAIVRAHVERVEVVGLDEAYLDVDGLFSPRAAMRRLLAEISNTMQLTCSVGIGPNKLVAKVASDAEKPAGFVVLSREQACARFACGTARPGTWHRAEDRRTSGRAGADDARRTRRAPEQLLIERFGPNLGRELGRRARFEHDGEIGAARKVVSESRERTFDYDVSDPAELRGVLTQMAGELCASLAAHGRSGAHDRDQGPPRRLDDRHARTQRARADMRRQSW